MCSSSIHQEHELNTTRKDKCTPGVIGGKERGTKTGCTLYLVDSPINNELIIQLRDYEGGGAPMGEIELSWAEK